LPFYKRLDIVAARHDGREYTVDAVPDAMLSPVTGADDFFQRSNHGWKMYQCPYCGKPAISAPRKIILGPGVPVACQACGKSIKITYPSWLKAAMPGVAVMVVALFFDSDLLVYGLSTAGLALMIALHLLWVPLVKEE